MRLATFACFLALVLADSLRAGEASLRPVRPPICLEMVAPQGITRDDEGFFWVTSAVAQRVVRLSPDFSLQEQFLYDLPSPPNVVFDGFTGATFNPLRASILVARPATSEIVEIAKSGELSGRVLPVLGLIPPPNIVPLPLLKGIAFDPFGGAGGEGSLWVQESVLTGIYEVSMATGFAEFRFCHPDDTDGCPGSGGASRSNGPLCLYFENEGEPPVGLELTCGRVVLDGICRVEFDGELTGTKYPIGEVGGHPGGFLRLRGEGPEGRDLFVVTVESSAEIHVLEVFDADILPLRDVRCTADSGEVSLSWSNMGEYDEIEIRREGEPIALLEGGATSFTDATPPDGVLEYEIVARSSACAGCETRESCETVIGAGAVIRTVRFADIGPSAATPVQLIDIAEDGEELLWITHEDNAISVFDKELTLVDTVAGPFTQPEGPPVGEEPNRTSGIAYNPRNDTLFVYNSTTHRIVEMNRAGEAVSAPMPSGIEPQDPEVVLTVSSMLFDANGDGGSGSFWFSIIETGSIQERSRGGALLSEGIHPDQLAQPPPPKGYLRTLLGGMSAVPPAFDFRELELAGGRVRDTRVTRLLRLDMKTCQPTGREVPIEGILTWSVPAFVAYHLTTHDGVPVAFAISTRRSGSRLFEIDTGIPPVPHVGALTCEQPAVKRDVLLRFVNPGNLDAIEVRRDEGPWLTIPGDASSHTDTDAPAGFHTYRVRGVRAGERGDDRECSLQVGQGSIAYRDFTFPVTLIHQLAFDPLEETYVAISKGGAFRDLYLFDRDLSFLGEVPSPFTRPTRIAAVTVRAAGDESEILVLGQNPGDSQAVEFPLVTLDHAGNVLRNDVRIGSFPAPGCGGLLITAPAGMAWDASSDTLWVLERNAPAVLNYTLSGLRLGGFLHPAPIHQDKIHGFGMTIAPERNTLYLGSAGRFDRQVTKLVEVTRSGRLTGLEIPLDLEKYNELQGLALSPEGTEIIVAAGILYASVFDLVAYRVFDPLAPVSDLACTGSTRMRNLSWSNNAVYERLRIYRNQEPAAEIDGGSTSWIDEQPITERVFYRVVGLQGAMESAGVVCEATFEREFRRGDTEKNDSFNLTDAIVILRFLFAGDDLYCRKAGDVDDNGILQLTDAVRLLEFLFRSGATPPPPHDQPGLDPTPDGLTCPLR